MKGLTFLDRVLHCNLLGHVTVVCVSVLFVWLFVRVGVSIQFGLLSFVCCDSLLGCCFQLLFSLLLLFRRRVALVSVVSSLLSFQLFCCCCCCSCSCRVVCCSCCCCGHVVVCFVVVVVCFVVAICVVTMHYWMTMFRSCCFDWLFLSFQLFCCWHCGFIVIVIVFRSCCRFIVVL